MSYKAFKAWIVRKVCLENAKKSEQSFLSLEKFDRKPIFSLFWLFLAFLRLEIDFTVARLNLACALLFSLKAFFWRHLAYITYIWKL